MKALGRGAWLSKVDIEFAFPIIPLHPSQWHLLGMTWDGKFSFDKRLTMGGRSSPFAFDKLPTGIEWICQCKCLIKQCCQRILIEPWQLHSFTAQQWYLKLRQAIITGRTRFSPKRGIAILGGRFGTENFPLRSQILECLSCLKKSMVAGLERGCKLSF